MPLFPDQICASKKVVESLDAVEYVVLKAPPQSGKTGTLLLSGAEMFRRGKIRTIVIMGHSDCHLRDQMRKAVKEFTDYSYDAHLLNTVGMDSIDERHALKRSLSLKDEDDQGNIIIAFGGDLMKQKKEFRDTLFIRDESHAAQDHDMRPAKFLQSIGLSSDGDRDKLQRNNNFILSVSATGFSELANIQNDSTQMNAKAVVLLGVGAGYVSPIQMIKENRIIGFDSVPQVIRDACAYLVETRGASGGQADPDLSNKYGIVRITSSTAMAQLEEIAAENGIVVKQYNSKCKEFSMGDLKVAPDVPTIVVIKGMFRMGVVFEKKFISFVLETSEFSNTDVVAQGLLGRMLGYHDYNVRVYLSQKILDTGDFGRYAVSMTPEFNPDTDPSPDRGTNVISTPTPKNVRASAGAAATYQTIPIHISAADFIVDGSTDDEAWRHLPVAINFARTNNFARTESIKAAIADGRCENLNDDGGEDGASCRDVMARVISDTPAQMFEFRNAGCASYKKVAEKIGEMRRTLTPIGLGSSGGSGTGQVVVYVYSRAVPEFGIRAGDVFISTQIPIESPRAVQERKQARLSPKTTGKESFCSTAPEPIMLPDQIDQIDQIGSSSRPAVTAPVVRHRAQSKNYTDIADDALTEEALVQLAVSGNSLELGRISVQAMVRLSRGGDVYESLLLHRGIKVSVTKVRGSAPENLTRAGIVRVASISAAFPTTRQRQRQRPNPRPRPAPVTPEILEEIITLTPLSILLPA